LNFFLEILLNGLLSGGVYALMGLALVIIYKSSSIFNFAHGSLVAFTTFLLWQLIVGWHVPIWLAVPLLVAFTFLVSYLVQRLVLQPLIGQSLMSAIMATIALGEFLHGAAVLFWPGPGRMLPPFIGASRVRIGSIAVSGEALLNFAVCSVCFAVFLAFFHKTRFGLAMRGTAEDHMLAESEGVSVSRVFIVSWFVAILIAAVGGILMSSLFGISFEPLHGLGMKGLAVVIFGGLESIVGAMIGGLVIGVVESLSSGYFDPYVGGGSAEVAPYIVLLVALLFRPYGLFGYQRIERV